MDKIIQQFRQKFLDEAGNLVTSLEKDLLALENDQHNKAIIEEVFRVMHTLKGISSMYGFNFISEFTHRLENVYDLIREDKMDIDVQIIDFTFDAADHIKNLLVDEFLMIPVNKEKHGQLINLIDGILKNKSEKPAKLPETEKPASNKTYYILFNPDEALFYRGVNLLAIFTDLSAIGKYTIFKHNFANLHQGTTDDDSWGIILSTTAEYDAVLEVFLWVEDNIKITKISDKDLFDIDGFIKSMQESQNITSENDLDNIPLDQIDIKNIQKTEQIEIKPVEQNTVKQTVNNKAQNENKVEHLPTPLIYEKHSSRISVDSEKLDLLMFLVSELVTTNAQLTQANKSKDLQQMERVVEKVEKLTKLFRDNALNLRLIPINDIIIRFQRLIRDLSHQLNKEVKFVTEGTETELDKNVIDSLVEPLMHLIRNCIDHGIETPERRQEQGKPAEGIIKLTAHYEGTYVIIKVEDDGNGLDIDKILCKAIEKGFVAADAKLTHQEIVDLIFLPGFSTAESLSQVSGRGVGMDVVKRKIADIRGEVTIETEKGQGTAFIIKLQQTVSILDTLLIKADQIHFMIPLSEIEVCDARLHSEIFQNNNRQVEHNKSLTPFIHLRTEFNLSKDCPKMEKIIFVKRNNQIFSIVADKIIGEHQAVLKPLGRTFSTEQFLMGASILGDGSMALMLDTGKLCEAVFK